MKPKYPSCQKLWRVTKELDGLYYEIKLAGTVIDRVPIPEDTLKMLIAEGVI